jgi:hypothetical protein
MGGGAGWGGLLGAAALGAAALGAALGAARVLRLRAGKDRAWPLRRAPRRLGGVCRLKPDMFEQYTRVRGGELAGRQASRTGPAFWEWKERRHAAY